MWNDFLKSVTFMHLQIAAIAAAVLLLAAGILLRKKKDSPLAVWFCSGILGILVGVASSLAILKYHGMINPQVRLPDTDASTATPPAGPASMAGMMPAAGGGNTGADSRVTLVNFVRKLGMLSDGLKLDLTDEQKAKAAEALKPLASAKTLTNAEATSVADSLRELLNNEQRRTVNSIDIPQTRGTGSGPAENSAASGAQERNPFLEEVDQDRLQSLLKQLGDEPEAAKE